MEPFRKFSLIIFYFQVFALCCVALNFKSGKQKRLHSVIFTIWSILNVFLVASNAIAFSVFVAAGAFKSLTSILKFYVIVLTHLVILVESLMTRDNHVEIWRNITRVDANLKHLHRNIQKVHSEFFNRCVVKFLAYLGIAWLIEIWIILSIQSDREWTFIWYAEIASLMISRSRHLQQTLYIDSLAYRFKIIKKELKAMVAESRVNQSLPKQVGFDVHSEKIILMKDIYNSLWETSVLINKSFGFSQLVNFLQNFFQLTTDLYTIYSILYQNSFAYIFGMSFVSSSAEILNHSDPIYISELFYSLMPTIIIVILVLNSCEQCLKQVRFIGFLLHNIEKDPDNHKFDILIENFSLLILHEPLKFSVCGFFNMDFTLLKAVRGCARAVILIWR